MEKLAREARKILWTAKDDEITLFGNRNISSNDYMHWDTSTCKPQDCNVCNVLVPSSTGFFSDERIFPATNTSHILYDKLREFQPYKIHIKQGKTTHKAPSKLLDITSREIIHDTVGKRYFTVSHVWSSNYFGGVPFSENNKGYSWLKRMSKLLKIRYAWIDTCCIDQDNIDEKQREIGNMREYYMNAASCAVLFSSTTPKNVDTFIANIRLLAHKAVDNPYRRLGHVWALASIFESNLLVDEWFTRVWTIQEIILGRSVVVDSSCGLVDLTELLKSYHTLVYSIGKMVMCTGEMSQTQTLSYHLHNQQDSYDMASVLELCMGRQATNGHDYVYGILGLLPNVDIEVNYKLPLESVMVSIFREATRNGDLSWISWIGSSFLENYSFIPMIGSPLYINRWSMDANKLSVTFDDKMVIKSAKMDVEIIGIAKWNGIYPGTTNACVVLHMLCLDEKLCHSCTVMKFCNDGCCTPHAIRVTMAMTLVNGNFCAGCLESNDEWTDKCSKHMERLLDKEHDCCVMLMKTPNGKYLIGKTDDQLVPDNRYQQVLMFGNREMYRGWMMNEHDRIGVVPFHEKDFVIDTEEFAQLCV